MASLTKGRKHPGVPPSWSCEEEQRTGGLTAQLGQPASGSPESPKYPILRGTLPSRWAAPLFHPHVSGQIQGFLNKQSQNSSAGEDCRAASVKDTVPVQGTALRWAPSGFIHGSVFPWLQDLSSSRSPCSIRWFTAVGNRAPCTIWFGWRYYLEVQEAEKGCGQGTLVEKSSVWEASRTIPRVESSSWNQYSWAFILSAHELASIHGSLSHPAWPGSLFVMVSLPLPGRYCCTLRRNLWPRINWN